MPPGRSIVVTIPKPWSRGSPRNSIPFSASSAIVELRSSHMSVNSCCGVSPGWTPSSAGGSYKDQPAVGRVVALDRIPAQRVAQCLAQQRSLARVEEYVRADDRHAVMLRLECGISGPLSERIRL
jgi:hypothetical protein